MIKTVSSTGEQLVSKDSQNGALVFAIFAILIGLTLVVGGLVSPAMEVEVSLIVGAVALVVGIITLLLRATHSYIFDKRRGELRWAVRGLVKNKEGVYALSDISKLVKWRQLQIRSGSGGSDKNIIIHYALKFSDGEQITLAQKRENYGLLSMVTRAARGSRNPQPIQDIANFLGVEVASENSHVSGMLKKTVGALTNR